jgi:hypothetical protein
MTAKNQIKQLRIIFLAISCGLVLFFITAWFLGTMRGPFYKLDAAQMQYLKTLVLLLAFAGIPAAHYYHKKKTDHINPQLPIQQKLVRFRTSYFIKLSTFEGLALISLLSYLLSNDNTFLLVFALFMVVLVINYPSKAKIAEELNETPESLFDTDETLST